MYPTTIPMRNAPSTMNVFCSGHPAKARLSLLSALLMTALGVTLGCNNLTSLHQPSIKRHLDGPILSLPYKMILTDERNNDQRLPIVVAFHGLGGNPDEMVRALAAMEVPARIIAPHGLFPFGMQGGASWYANAIPSRTSDPHLMAEDMNYAADMLAHFVNQLMAHYDEAGKPIITGYSQGGMLTYALSVRYPHLIGSAIPVAGFMPSTLMPQQSLAVGSYPKFEALHGYNDKIVPFEADLDSVETLNYLGQKAVLYKFNNTGHFMSQRMFDAYLLVLDRTAVALNPDLEWE
ncbi:MAG: hypothetical protein CMH56_09820 [Myxococcales bacterium]|nr:hypothetical protein [Myxococcales bacterium]